jgi:hypothetical protein
MNTLIERFILLYEKKDHLINKNQNLTDEQKSILKDFFTKYPVAEKEEIGEGKMGIDWNRKDLTFSDFQPLMDKYINNKIEKEKDREERKKSWKYHITRDLETPFIEKIKEDEKIIKTMEEEKYYGDEDEDETDIYEEDNYISPFEPIDYKVVLKSKDFIIVEPLNWWCAQFMDNTELYGVGAKWCIGDQKTNGHWESYYEKDNSRFIFIFLAKEKQKFMVEINYHFHPSLLEEAIEYEHNDYDKNTMFISETVLERFSQVLKRSPDSIKQDLLKYYIIDDNNAVIFPSKMDEYLLNWKELCKDGKDEILKKYLYDDVFDEDDFRYNIWNATDKNIYGTNNLNRIFEYLNINLSSDEFDIVRKQYRSPDEINAEERLGKYLLEDIRKLIDNWIINKPVKVNRGIEQKPQEKPEDFTLIGYWNIWKMDKNEFNNFWGCRQKYGLSNNEILTKFITFALDAVKNLYYESTKNNLQYARQKEKELIDWINKFIHNENITYGLKKAINEVKNWRDMDARKNGQSFLQFDEARIRLFRKILNSYSSI